MIKIPKAYVFTVEGVLDEEGGLKKFSTPSYGQDINDEMDVGCIVQSSAQSFYLNNLEYQDQSLWPLTFRFQTDGRPLEFSVELTFSPCFLAKQDSIVKVIEAPVKAEEDVSEEQKPQKTTRKKAKGKEDEVDNTLLTALSSYEGHLTLVNKPRSNLVIKYGASLTDVSQLEHVLTSIKAVSQDFVKYFKIKYNEQDFVIQISEVFYEALFSDEVFDPTIAEEGELNEAWHYV